MAWHHLPLDESAQWTWVTPITHPFAISGDRVTDVTHSRSRLRMSMGAMCLPNLDYLVY
jgi:hypothetical protein